jgi:hypothetical protein
MHFSQFRTVADGIFIAPNPTAERFRFLKWLIYEKMQDIL